MDPLGFWQSRPSCVLHKAWYQLKNSKFIENVSHNCSKCIQKIVGINGSFQVTLVHKLRTPIMVLWKHTHLHKLITNSWWTSVTKASWLASILGSSLLWNLQGGSNIRLFQSCILPLNFWLNPPIPPHWESVICDCLSYNLHPTVNFKILQLPKNLHPTFCFHFYSHPASRRTCVRPCICTLHYSYPRFFLTCTCGIRTPHHHMLLVTWYDICSFVKWETILAF